MPAAIARRSTMPTQSAQQALKILRDGSQFQWYVITLFALVVYVYAVEIERKHWSLVFAGLAYWGMDWFNEIWNGLVFHFTQYAPVWGAPGKTAFLILIGLNIEICFMFAIAGIAFAKMLPADRRLRILGIPNRLLFAVVGSAFCVLVEILFNSIGALTWDYSWWNAGAPWLIFLIGYLTFFLVSFWVFDMESVKKQATVVGVIGAVDLVSLVLFGVILRWI
jgi:ABC-type phosphate/phosphonate transport system permease subunit